MTRYQFVTLHCAIIIYPSTEKLNSNFLLPDDKGCYEAKILIPVLFLKMFLAVFMPSTLSN
jgi:hypothetical protein